MLNLHFEQLNERRDPFDPKFKTNINLKANLSIFLEFETTLGHQNTKKNHAQIRQESRFRH